MILLLHRFEKTLVKEGFGYFAEEEHEILIPKKDQDGNIRHKLWAKTKLCLYENQHQRICNVNETEIPSGKTADRRIHLLVSENLPNVGATSSKCNEGKHVSMVGGTIAMEYSRTDKNGKLIEYKKAEMLPMQV